MTMLASMFRERIKDTKDLATMSEMTYSVSYPTGFLPLDLITGYVQEINGKYHFELGISDGSINTLIGNSGTGKTSLLIGMACSIIRPFKTSVIFFEQAEVGTNIQRIRNLSGISDANGFAGRFVVRDAGISIESIYKRIMTIYNIKIKNPEKYQYNTGIIDMFGKPVYKFEPTVVIIDSVKMVQSEARMIDSDGNIENDKVTNMDGATEARDISIYYKKMVPMCRVANIIIIMVNHITKNIQTGYLPQKNEFPFLRQGEHLGSANMLNYLSNLMLRLDITTKLVDGDAKNSWGINGSIVSVDAVKSRTGKTGRNMCDLVFDQSIGFDKDLSMLLLLKSRDAVQGSGAYLKLPNCDTKFSLRNFKKLLYQDEDFRNKFNLFSYQFITSTLIDEYKRIQEEIDMSNNSNSSYNAILNMFKPIDAQDLNSTMESDEDGE